LSVKLYKIILKQKLEQKYIYNLIFSFYKKNVRITFNDFKGNVIFKTSNGKYKSIKIHTYDNLKIILQKIKDYFYKKKIFKKFKFNIIYNGTLFGRNFLNRAILKANLKSKINSFSEKIKITHNGVKLKKKKRK